MAKQQHFVVVVEEDGSAWVDYDTAYVKFDGRYTWDTETEEWLDTQDESYQEYETASELIHDLLIQTAKTENGVCVDDLRK